MKNNDRYSESVQILLESKVAIAGEKDVKRLSAFFKSTPFASGPTHFLDRSTIVT
jgi:hypothetical protein